MTRRTRILEATTVAVCLAAWFALYCTLNPPTPTAVKDCQWASRAGTSCLARGHSVDVCCFNQAGR